MTDWGRGEQRLFEVVLIEGERDEVDVGFIHSLASRDFPPLARKEVVLRLLRRVLGEGLMDLTSVVDGEYRPYHGRPEDLVAMVAETYPYADDGITYDEDLLFLYWMVNTPKGDRTAERLVEQRR